MLDIVLAVTYIALLIAALIVARSLTVFSATTFVTASFLGALIQFIGVGWRSFTLRELQIWVLIGLLIVLAVSLVVGRKDIRSRSAMVVTAISAIAVTGGFLLARLLAPSSPEVLSGVGYLINRPGAEDNAKWLNATSQLAQGFAVDSWANVGGPLIVVFTLCATLISALSVLLYGGVNQVAVAADTVLLAEHLLVIIAPFALAPVLEMRRKRDGQQRIPVPLSLLAIVILIAAVAWPLEFGHVTLQYTVLAFTLWIGVFLAQSRSWSMRALVTVGVALTAMVWFPIAPVAIASLVAVAAWSIRQRAWGILGAAVAAVILMAEFLSSAIRFAVGSPLSSAAPARTGGSIGGVTANTGVLPLFDSPGGTAIASTAILLITGISVIGALAHLSARNINHRALLVRFAPVVLLSAYAWGITIVDFWAVGAGPNYASLKVVYAAVLPILATTIAIAPLAIEPTKSGMTALRWGAGGAVLLVLTVDPFISRIAAQMRPELWPSTADFPYWAPAEVRPVGDQPLASNPIACVYLPPGAELPSALPFGQRAYSCSRMLAGLAGLETEADSIVQWQLRDWLNNANTWDEAYPYFTLMGPEVRSRSVTLLNGDDQVIGIEPFERLYTRFAPQE